ncbi:MAG: hypothetical protein ACRD1S_00800 [Vicinamibacterales bacterium]
MRATCPAHSDPKPSLAVTRDERGVLIHCFAGCAKGAPARALGLRPSDLFVGPRPSSVRPAIVATYDYVDRDGVLLAQKVRLQPKAFRWRRPDSTARGGWRWTLDGVALPPLYRWFELVGVDLVFITEGEKAADRIRDLGLVATCPPAGASTWKASADLLEAVTVGAAIAILPDNDPPGERQAERVAADLYARGRERGISLKVVRLPPPANGADAFDWVEGGGTREQLLEFVAATPTWSPEAAALGRAKHRADLARERKRAQRWRAREGRAMTRVDDSRASRHSDAVADALKAVRVELERAGEPRSGRALKAALAGRYPRDVVDAALEIGREPGGSLICDERGQRRGCPKLYSVRTLDDSPGIHRVTDRAGHSQSVRTAEPTPDTRITGFPEQKAASKRPVTLSRGHAGERSSDPLQEKGSVSLSTAVTGGPDTVGVTRGPDTQHSDNHQQRAIEDGRCCGRDGSELRCKLCRWSSTYWRRTLEEDASAPAAATCATLPCEAVSSCALVGGCLRQRFPVQAAP